MMKSKVFVSNFFIVLLIVILGGCDEERSKGKLSFDNNMEGSFWEASPSMIFYGDSHSGKYVARLNKQTPYSTIANIRVRDISSKQLKRAHISAWFKLTSNKTEQNLVFDIRDSSMANSVEWIGMDASDYIGELNKWINVELDVDLTQKNRNNVGLLYRIYAYNGKDEDVFVDDFEVSFEE